MVVETVGRPETGPAADIAIAVYDAIQKNGGEDPRKLGDQEMLDLLRQNPDYEGKIQRQAESARTRVEYVVAARLGYIKETRSEINQVLTDLIGSQQQ